MMAKASVEKLVIEPPNFQVGLFRIRGNAPMVQNKFSEKAKADIKARHEQGEKGKKGSKSRKSKKGKKGSKSKKSKKGQKGKGKKGGK